MTTWRWSDIRPGKPPSREEPKHHRDEELTARQRERQVAIEQAMIQERRLIWLPWLEARDRRLAAARQEMGLEPSKLRRRLKR